LFRVVARVFHGHSYSGGYANDDGNFVLVSCWLAAPNLKIRPRTRTRPRSLRNLALEQKVRYIIWLSVSQRLSKACITAPSSRTSSSNPGKARLFWVLHEHFRGSRRCGKSSSSAVGGLVAMAEFVPGVKHTRVRVWLRRPADGCLVAAVLAW
jgi:hypothetical protein